MSTAKRTFLVTALAAYANEGLGFSIDNFHFKNDSNRAISDIVLQTMQNIGNELKSLSYATFPGCNGNSSTISRTSKTEKSILFIGDHTVFGQQLLP